MILGGWGCVSFVLCWVLGVFRLRKLALAPGRFGRLSLLQFFAAIGLYLGLGIIAAGVMGAAHPELAKENTVATAPAVWPAAASGPATWPAIASAPATAAATATGSLPATAASEPASDPKAEAQRAKIEIQQNFANFICLAIVSGLMLFLAQRSMVEGLAGFGLSVRGIPLGIAVGLLAAFILVPFIEGAGIASNILNSVLNAGPPPVHPVLEMAQKSSNMSLRVVLILSAVVAAPFSEELLFRGLLQTALLRIFRQMVPERLRQGSTESSPVTAELWYAIPEADLLVRLEALSRWGAIVMASLMFALVHYTAIGWQGMPEIFVLSLGLGYVYERTGNLWANMTLHATFNAVSFAAFLGAFG